ncbi:MAG: hypothetical protein HY064_14640 [Bacteroidetes bacterium]|nr:hypothetical protein [Bacteroidota bacterium]
MKKLLLSLLIIFCFFSKLFSQPASIDQRDSSGKKNGKWKVYWDASWHEVKDSAKAVYYRYTFYDHGEDVYPMGPRDKKWKLVASTETKSGGKLILLDGEYKWYDEKGILRDDDVFKNGEYVSYKWYYSTGELNQFFDYGNHWQDQTMSWHIFEYDKTGKVTTDTYVHAKGYGEKK